MKMTVIATLSLVLLICGCELSTEDLPAADKIDTVCNSQANCHETGEGQPYSGINEADTYFDTHKAACVNDYNSQIEEDPNFERAINCIYDCPTVNTDCATWNTCMVACKAEY